jgi:hypothetical protein
MSVHENVTGERRSAGAFQLTTLFLTVLVNVVVIVWAVATLSAEVTTLRETVTPLVGDVYRLKVDQAIRLDRETRGTTTKERDR